MQPDEPYLILALPKFNSPILHLDFQMSLEHEKKFILIFMAMPCQRTADFGNFDVRIIDFCNDAR